MNEDLEKLLFLFNEIKNKGWIKSTGKGTSRIGLTFEKEIGKPIENFEIPDFGCIEIKTHKKAGKFPITLFNAAPDGKSFFEIKRIVEKYGYPSPHFQKTNILCGNVNAVIPSLIGSYYKFQLFVNYNTNKVELHIYNINNKLIDTESSWSFDLIKEKLYRKLKYLALVDAISKVNNGTLYFKYDSIAIYELSNLDNFLLAIKNGNVIITFSINCFLSGKRIGQIHDHGTAFRIQEKNIQDIYKRII